MELWCFSLTSDISVCWIFHPSFLPGRSSDVAFLIPWISSIVLVVKLVCCRCSVPKSCPTLCHPMDCNMSGFSVLHYLLEFAPIHAIELMMPSNHLILCCLLHLPSIFSSIRAFSNKSAVHIRWPKSWSFRISPFHEYSVLISLEIDWSDLLTVQGWLDCSDLGTQENKSHCFHFFCFCLSLSDGIRCMILVFLNVDFFSQLFHSALSPLSRGCLVLHFLPLEQYHLHVWGC